MANLPLATAPVMEVEDNLLVKRYVDNKISKAVVIGGLEPFDDWYELYSFILTFREVSSDDIVIYTGYYEHEIQPYIDRLKGDFANIIVKLGRFIPDQQPHYDEVLGVKLASDNQKGVQIC